MLETLEFLGFADVKSLGQRRKGDYRASEMRDNPMAIYLVGETIDAKRAHQRAQGGELIPLVRGVYVDHDGDAEAAILGHAVRIAHYLYPNAYLSSASAVLLAPTPDGRLFISGRRNQRTRFADPGDHPK
jgi:serine/threonine-protein kinase HipA